MRLSVLKALRLANNHQQRDVAKTLGIDISWLSRIETGKLPKEKVRKDIQEGLERLYKTPFDQLIRPVTTVG